MAALARCRAVQNPILPILRDAEVDVITSQVRPDLVIVPAQWRGFDHEAMARRLLAGTGARILVCDIPSVPAPGTFALPVRARVLGFGVQVRELLVSVDDVAELRRALLT